MWNVRNGWGVGLIALWGALGCESRSEASVTPPAPPVVSAPVVVAAPPAGKVSGSLCDKLCGRAAELKCRGSEGCLAGCREMHEQPVCQSEMRAALECFVSRPLDAWECGDEGMPAMKDGHCDAEQARVVACLDKR